MSARQPEKAPGRPKMLREAGRSQTGSEEPGILGKDELGLQIPKLRGNGNLGQLPPL
jgi:hypothetical protein